MRRLAAAVSTVALALSAASITAVPASAAPPSERSVVAVVDFTRVEDRCDVTFGFTSNFPGNVVYTYSSGIFGNESAVLFPQKIPGKKDPYVVREFPYQVQSGGVDATMFITARDREGVVLDQDLVTVTTCPGI